MLMGDLWRRLGNERAVENARLASTELSNRRVEHEAVEIFLERLAARRADGATPGPAVADR